MNSEVLGKLLLLQTSTEEEGMARSLIQSLEENDLKAYYGDYATTTDAYLIVRAAILDLGKVDHKLLGNIANEMLEILVQAIPAKEKNLYKGNNEIFEIIEEQANLLDCKPEEIMAPRFGGDDALMDLGCCHLWVKDMISLLEKINTETAKLYIAEIKHNPTLVKALNMIVLDL